ncbi:PA14 domain-containing protein [Streptomyces griseus]|uniref:PA14 domain-containing protein n=1 Tax=Streptomyces griseus TaxID=1911 RepID=UPI0037BA4086
MAHTRRIRALAAAGATALSFTLLGAGFPASAGTAARGDATRVPLLPAPDATGDRPAWPAAAFGTAAPVKGAVRAVASRPADGAVLSGVRPELVADRRTGRARYEFVVATGDAPRTGQVTSSGWVSSPRWQVPAGVLRDGGRYTWTVRTKDSSGRVGEDSAARGFTVNQRLGARPEGGPAPTDGLGPVTVNLATGNVTASVDTARTSTGAGLLGATFTYNSQAVESASGLTGAYYAGDPAAGIGADEKPAAVRADARVDFRWGGESPLPGTKPDAAFRVAWKGRLAVPADGTYRLGGVYDGGLRILVDGKPLLDDWRGADASGDRPVYGRPVALESGRSYAVEVQHRRPVNGRQVGLWVSRPGRAAPVPASWLRPDAEVLPPGWTVTPAAAGQGGDAPADASGVSGAPRASGAGGAPGALAAQGSTPAAPVPVAAGASAPHAPRKGPAGAAGRAEADAAAGPAAGIEAAEDAGTTFLYAGDDDCADAAAPAGFVCAVRVPGAGTTQLHYRNGKLSRLVNPGAETTDFGYTSGGLLGGVRPPLVMDWIAAGAGRDTEAARYRIDYRPGSAAASRVTGPAPDGTAATGDARPRRDYTYSPGATEVGVAGVRTPQGWARRVTHDTAGRTTTDTDGTRRTTRYTWTAADQPESTTDPAGRLSTTVHDASGMPVGEYGPGPRACFGPDLRPVSPAPEGCGAVPATTTTLGPEGLTTVRADSLGVPPLVALTRFDATGLPAELVTDPDGLALTTGYEFDEAFRPVAEILANGTRKTYGYYGPTESADNPCTAGNDPVAQRGLPRSITLPTAADGTARVEKFVYGARGLPVAVNFGGPDWTCVAYDDRGRIGRMSMPGNSSLPAWSVDYDSAHGGDPLTLRATQHDHFVTSTVDLLGRTVSYTDGRGTRTRTAYDRAGRAELQRVTPPSGATQTERTRYDAAGRVLAVVLNGRQLASTAHDDAGSLRSVRYANGMRLSVARDEAGRITAKNWVLADGTERTSEVTRSRSGAVVDESLAGQESGPGGPDFRYDAAGRLVEARITGHTYTRDFTAPSAGECPDGTRANAGANGNVARLTDRTADGSTVTGYCYDDADRLLATTGDDPVTDTAYGLNGHLTGYRSGGARLTQRQDAVERHIGVAVTGPGAADVRYTKDIADRFLTRTATTDAGSESVGYGHTDMNDPAPDLVFGEDGRLLTRVIGLPGGVVLSHAAGAPAAGRTTTWSAPTVRGDLFLVAGDTGRQQGDLYRYGLYGEALRADGTVDPQHLPDNLPGDFDYGWLGQYQVGTEHEGALYNVVLDTRVLNTAFGRFSAPVSGGPFLNPYEYAAGDPVNRTSINGYDLDVETE